MAVAKLALLHFSISSFLIAQASKLQPCLACAIVRRSAELPASPDSRAALFLCKGDFLLGMARIFGQGGAGTPLLYLA
jgi:hypothetical protein